MTKICLNLAKKIKILHIFAFWRPLVSGGPGAAAPPAPPSLRPWPKHKENNVFMLKIYELVFVITVLFYLQKISLKV